MQRNDYESMLAVFESGYDAIEDVLNNEALAPHAKVYAISEIIYGHDEEPDDDQSDDDDDDADDAQLPW